jgi:hypothetical protein
MNERIRELMAQAGFDPAAIERMGIMPQAEKFAKLIVKECANIADELSKLYPRTDVAFDVGYTMGTTRATKAIKDQFGVEL